MGGRYSLPSVGVPWSPKLVKVNGARPRGEVLERTEFRVGAVVHGPVQINEVGPQLIELRMIGVDDLAGLGIGVTNFSGIDGLLELAIETAEHHAGISNRLQRVPEHHHL